MKKLILIILDGWGITSFENLKYSAISQAHTPFLDFCFNNYPYSELFASGEEVGLPKGQMGNSEVGHINLGSGRKVIQTLEKINLSIQNNDFRKLIYNIFDQNYLHNKNIHLIGLLSDGGVHSHMDHLFYLLKIFHEKKIKNIFIHVFTDGRDSNPKNGIEYINKLIKISNKYVGKLSTIIGRYYAMDRDRRWERTKIAYDSMTNLNGDLSENIYNSMKVSYEKGITDEFLKPIIMVDKKGDPISRIENKDVVFCFNFRPDRSRQITEFFINDNKNFCINKGIKNINLSKYITMTCFKESYKNVEFVFKNEKLLNTLGEILSKKGKKQIRIAETEKYPHVTFFFSGGREKPFKKETRIMCPSPKVATYDLKPEMSSWNILKKLIPELKKKYADFICLNFANPDMVGHTGNMIKTIQACEIVDKCTKICIEEAVKNSYMVIIVGDHGNAEYMINKDGSMNTSHTTSMVPFVFLKKNIKKQNILLKKKNSLSDVAPTILKLMNLPIPNAMTGIPIIENYKIN
ncbi:2,3-bisphosphoglycerate-independent phosphoglycerate mutase [Blattabacterium cuenoti]|uniref:2,3-bisphosphoglycerate-independent phosphoglycerate mutase n=1 Tax=Blattabacterium cuenoti TaxID=1653831 RepID=UPI00163CE059|nr:2,3-bisphosphoglycerate-independent phosphoglycerate mutase [Blattabacterium cuenoti]